LSDLQQICDETTPSTRRDLFMAGQQGRHQLSIMQTALTFTEAHVRSNLIVVFLHEH
jgi:hypothetical protein